MYLVYMAGDACIGNLCSNGGVCIRETNGYRCQCSSGYVGPLCQQRMSLKDQRRIIPCIILARNKYKL